MRKLIILSIFLLITTIVCAQTLKEIKVFYYDDQTEKGKTTYREFKGVGEGPWSKPEKIDIVLSFYPRKLSYEPHSDEIEILIEEQYEPTSLLKRSPGVINDKRWVPHEVVYSGNSNFIKSGKIVIKDFPYKTAYFLNSLLYSKDGFKIVGIFHNVKTGKLERVERTFYYE